MLKTNGRDRRRKRKGKKTGRRWTCGRKRKKREEKNKALPIPSGQSYNFLCVRVATLPCRREGKGKRSGGEKVGGGGEEKGPRGSTLVCL